MIDRLGKLIQSRAKEYDLLDCRGGGRYMISTYEEHVFGLLIEDIPYLAETYQAYEALKGIATNKYSQDQLLCGGVHKRFPGIKQRPKSRMEFMLLCAKVADRHGGDAFYDKVQWWDRRAGKTIPALPADAEL